MPSFPGQICAHCGMTFTAHRVGQRYCGKSCSALATARRKVKVQAKCRGCGKGLEHWPSVTRSFCSRACLSASYVRERTCVVCAAPFISKKERATCSKKCLAETRRACASGRKHTPETRNRRSAALKVAWSSPAASNWRDAIGAGVRNWHSKPENARAAAHRASERMRLRHADPNWQRVRDERSSRVMLDNWRRHRERFVRQSVERYRQMVEGGWGLCSEDAKTKRRDFAKRLMKIAQAELRACTEIDEKMSELHHRLRREMPYDGPQTESDYLDYLQKLCRAITTHPEYREMADAFMAEAIPRIARQLKAA